MKQVTFIFYLDWHSAEEGHCFTECIAAGCIAPRQLTCTDSGRQRPGSQLAASHSDKDSPLLLACQTRHQ